jgi:hypothetical protein
MAGPISDWFHVSFNEDSIYIKINPPSRVEITDAIKWDEIIRVCFKTGDLFSSDEILIFIDSREESYLIPTEAFGAGELWGEIIERNLFNAELAIKAATAPEDEIFCWPEE